MKKYSLYILICGFILSLVSTGNVFSADARARPGASFLQANQTSLSSVQFPHDKPALHASNRTNATGNFHRIQGGPAFLSHSEFRLTHALAALTSNIAGTANFSFKDYLNHIYPSHNFW
jgi:hypothetical protein